MQDSRGLDKLELAEQIIDLFAPGTLSALSPLLFFHSSLSLFLSFLSGQRRFSTPIPTVDVFLLRGYSLQPVLLLRLLLSVSVSGEDVSAASFRSQEQPDHHPRDHSSHLCNDRNGTADNLTVP